MKYRSGKLKMQTRARGEISLWLLALMMAGFAAIAMGALFSMRYERNLFAEAIGALLKSPAGTATMQQARQAKDGLGRALGNPAAAAPAGALRKCVIGGKTVVSNVDCRHESTSKPIAIHDTRGIEAPKAPPAPARESSAANVQEKMIEKMTR
jgi:hypothetical protein